MASIATFHHHGTLDEDSVIAFSVLLDKPHIVSTPVSLLVNMFVDLYEMREMQLIRQVYSKKDRVLELGSGIGYTAMILAERIEYVVGLEPLPESFTAAEDNITLNDIANVHLINSMASTYDGTHAYYARHLAYGSSEFPDKSGCEVDTREVLEAECVDVNRLINGYDLNALHMDIEGSEITVLPHILSSYCASMINKVSFETHTHLLGVEGNKSLFRQLIASGLEPCLISAPHLFPNQCYVISFVREPECSELMSADRTLVGDVMRIDHEWFKEYIK